MIIDQIERENQILGHWRTNADVVILKDKVEAIHNHEGINHDLKNPQYEVKR